MNNYKPKDFAEMLGVSVKTFQRWDKEGKYKKKIEEDGELLCEPSEQK